MRKSACKPIRKIGDLIPDDQNANKGTERGLGMLEQSLRKYGAGRSILVDRQGRVIGGNKCLDRAAELGFAVRVVETDGKELVVVQRKDLDLKRDKAARELAIADNRVAEIDLDWDADEIKRLLAEGADLSAFFSDGEIEALIGRDEPGAAEDDAPSIEKAAELQKKWKTARGQLWTIKSKSGKAHRLLCGDSTSEEDVKRLVGKERPVWVWTDPPYGVEYEGKTKDKLRIKNDGAKDLPKLLGSAFVCADKVLQDGSPIYVAHPAGPLSLEFAKAFTEVGWRWHQTLIWLKDSIVLGHSDFHYKHEPLLYGWKGKKRHWYGGRSQASVLECDRPKASELHPTSKPVALIAACLANSSKAGDVGYEPFAGSGSTLVAAEQTGRVCVGMEIDPKYVAVVLERLSLLGLDPRLEGKR